MKKWVPNALTSARIALAAVFVLLWEIDLKPAAYAVFILASATDWLDGYIARKYGFISDFGKFADPLADKILVFSALILLIGEGVVPAWLIIFILFREFAVTGIRLIYSSRNLVIPAMFSGKLKTTVQILYIIIMAAAVIWKGPETGSMFIFILNAVLFLVSLYSFADYLIKLELNKIF